MDLRQLQDIEQLRRYTLTYKTQIDHLLKVLAQKCAQIDALRGEGGDLQTTLNLLEKMHKEAQKDKAPKDDKANKKKKRKKREKFGATPQPDLEQTSQRCLLDAPDCFCKKCGRPLLEWKDHFEKSQMIDVVEVSYRLVHVEKQQYICPHFDCGQTIETALGPELSREGGRYSLGFGIKVACDKFLEHTPLCQQTRAMKRSGLVVSAQTLFDQTYGLAEELDPCWRALYREAMASEVIGLDQTGWPCLNKKIHKTWQMWSLSTDRLYYHQICDDKGAKTFAQLLKGYEGYVVCDDMKSHTCGQKDCPGVILCGCWAHVFRKFKAVRKDYPQAQVALDKIHTLYEIDQKAQSLEDRFLLRQSESSQVLKELKAWLYAQPLIQSTSFGSAILYTLGYWSRLEIFLKDAMIPLDNNGCERGFRGPVIGRRRYFGCKSRWGTYVASIFYSLIETAKLHDVDPRAYLLEAVRAARVGEVLLPWQMAPA